MQFVHMQFVHMRVVEGSAGAHCYLSYMPESLHENACLCLSLSLSVSLRAPVSVCLCVCGLKFASCA